MRILIADDNALVRNGIAEILADNAWEVCGEASNGAETLERSRILEPDILLLDISMPDKNGFEIAATIKHEMPRIKILLVSNHDLDDLIDSAQARFAEGFVDKARLGSDLAPLICKVLREL